MAPIFQIPNRQTTWLLFAALMVVLSGITFGSLSAHLINAFGDEQDLIRDVKILTENPAYLFSPQRSAAVRPPVDLVFLIAYSLWGENPAGYHLLQIGLHLIASLLLAITMFRLGADLEFSLLSALLFLLNVAHFRSVQWVIAINYNLALIFSLSALVAYHAWLIKGHHHLLALLGLTAATFSHPSAVSAAAPGWDSPSAKWLSKPTAAKFGSKA